MNLGQRVNHKTFGKGLITGFEGQGNARRVQVNFENCGIKWLVLAYAGWAPKYPAQYLIDA